jgi:hypothetical protein
MKNGLVVLAAAALLVMGVSSAWADTITPGNIAIDDLTETVTTVLTQPSIGHLSLTPGGSDVSLTITGYGWAANTLTPNAKRAVVFVGVPGDYTELYTTFTKGSFAGQNLWVSDIAALTINSTGTGFTLIFSSNVENDGMNSLGFVNSDTTTSVKLVETGGWQEIGGLLGIDTVTHMQIRSDVPLPPTALLLGTGLLGLVGLRRFRKS